MKPGKLFWIFFAAVVFCCTSCGRITSDGEIQTVTIWSGDSHSKEFMSDRISKFNKTTGKDIGVKIEYVVKPDIANILEVALVTNQAPDMFGGGVRLEWLAANNYILPLNDIEGGNEYIAEYDPKYLNADFYGYKNKIYTVPYSTTTYGLLYNKDMFKKAGIVDENGEAKPPETLEELREDAKKLTNPDKQEYGIIFPAKWEGWYGSDINNVASVSSGFINGYNPATGRYEFGEIADIMKIYMGIKEDGSCFPGAEGIDNDPARAKFSMGKIGMKFAGSYDYAVLTEQFMAICDWGIAPLPRLEQSERHKTFAHIGGSCCINANLKNKLSDDQIMTIYRFMTDNEMLREAYKSGKTIPYDFNIVKDIELPEKMANWKTFAEFVSTSYTQREWAKTEVIGKKSIVSLWTDEIWTGKIPTDKIDEAVKECENDNNDGIQLYIDTHPDYDYSRDIDLNFDTRLQ